VKAVISTSARDTLIYPTNFQELSGWKEWEAQDC